MDETASEVQTSQHTLPMLKIEIEEEEACKNEKESPGNNYMVYFICIFCTYLLVK